MVHHAAGGADDHVGAAAQLAELDDHALAAVDGQHVEAGHLAGVTLEGLGNLDREFAGGSEHQHLRVALGEVDLVEGGQGEGGGFAGAGLGFAENVVAGEQERNAGGLDRRRGFVADLGEGREERRLEVELVEAFDGSSHGRGARAG